MYSLPYLAIVSICFRETVSSSICRVSATVESGWELTHYEQDVTADKNPETAPGSRQFSAIIQPNYIATCNLPASSAQLQAGHIRLFSSEPRLL
jgi:hypothetical protein